MLTDIALGTFTRTDAAGTRRGLRIAWSAPEGTEVLVRWHLRRDPEPWGEWLVSELQRGASFEVYPAEPGRYEVNLLDQQPGRSVIDYGFFEVDVEALLESPLELPRPSGLELVGPSGELLGSARAFTGRDLKIRWTPIRTDALQVPGLGEVPADELIEFAVVRVGLAGGAVLREVTLPVNVAEWTYSYAANSEDQALTADPASALRTVRLEVRWKDTQGRLGPPAVLEVLHTLQLSATGDLQLGAVNEFLIVSDQTDIELVAALEVEQSLETFVIDGPAPGAALLVSASDTLASFDFNLGASLILRYWLRIRSTASPATILHERHFDALTFIDIGGVLTTSASPQLTLTIFADDLVAGDGIYTVELSFEQFDPVDGPGSASEFVDLFSGDRIVSVQQVKR